MNSSLHNELTQLQEKLSTLDEAVEISTSTAKTTTKKQQEYASQLTNIQESLNKHQTPENLKNHLKVYNNESETVLNHYDTQMTAMENLLRSYQPLISQTQSLLNTIDQMNFPKQLNKLDTSISSINEGVKTVKNDVNELLTKIEEEDKNANLIKILLFLSTLLVSGTILLLMNITI